MCCGGDQAAALEAVDPLAGKSLVVAETAAGETRYRLLETIRQYAADRLAETGRGRAGPAAARRGVPAPGRAGTRTGCPGPRARQLPRRAGLVPVSTAIRPGRRWPGRWAASGWPADSSRKGRAGWSARSPQRPADAQLRAELLRLLGSGAVPGRRPATGARLSVRGLPVAAAAGMSAVQARIRVLQSEIQQPARLAAEALARMRGRRGARWKPRVTSRAWPRHGCWSESCVLALW